MPLVTRTFNVSEVDFLTVTDNDPEYQSLIFQVDAPNAPSATAVALHR